MVHGRLTGYRQVAPAEDVYYAYRRHEGNSLWREGLAMVARQKHNHQPALWILAALTRWWSLSLLLSHVTPHKHTRTRMATG